MRLWLHYRLIKSSTHPAAPQTARWPAPRCPACCGGGGSASWSCSRAWTGTAGSAPARRTPPGPQPATARRTRPAETRRVPGRALSARVGSGRFSSGGSHTAQCRCLSLSLIRGTDVVFLLSGAAAVRSAGSSRKREERAFLFRLSPPPLPLSLLPYTSPLCSSPSLLLSSILKHRFLLDEKSTAVKPRKAQSCASVGHFMQSVVQWSVNAPVQPPAKWSAEEEKKSTSIIIKMSLNIKSQLPL